MSEGFNLKGHLVRLKGNVYFGVSKQAKVLFKNSKLAIVPMADPGYDDNNHQLLAIITDKELKSDSEKPPKWEPYKSSDLLEGLVDEDCKNYKNSAMKLGKVQIRVSKLADQAIEKLDTKPNVENLTIRKDPDQENVFILGVSDDDMEPCSPRKIPLLSIIAEPKKVE